jgi:glycosyltransferase involved in cell wall biosynthesis
MSEGVAKPRSAIFEIFYAQLRRRTIRGYREYCPGKPSRTALLSYLVHPLILPARFRDPAQFSNQGLGREIPRALNELGYEVDIIDYRNQDWRPSRNYDLFIGHAHLNFARLVSSFDSPPVPIYFANGVYWREQNIRAARRLYDVALSKGALLPPERISSPAEEEAHRLASGTICLGNQATARTFAHLQNVVPIRNAAYPINSDNLARKDFEAGRKHFLFFSGLGNVHKGLDLLLQAFHGTDLHLHICQHIQPEFARVFTTELSETTNVHVHGFVKMRSPEFQKLTELCDWVILPTCAEGQPGSVIECMVHGLIPVLPDSANIDLEDWGYRIETLTVADVKNAISLLNSNDVRDCRRRAEKVVRAARERYSPESFREGFRDAVERIISVR